MSDSDMGLCSDEAKKCSQPTKSVANCKTRVVDLQKWTGGHVVGLMSSDDCSAWSCEDTAVEYELNHVV